MTTIPAQMSVAAQNLSLRAGSKQLLDRSQALFDSGQITLIVGPSGAGKSLLLRVLAGLEDSRAEGIEWSGDIVFPGADKPTPRRPVIGFVFQRFALFDELSPRENLLLASAHGSLGGSAAPAPPAADELLAELEVPPHLRTGVLSGGQRQRLAIARTLSQNAALIFYDEPTSGLDVAAGERVARLIRRTHDIHGKTSIIVTHDYETLCAVADRVYLLDTTRKVLREVPAEQWSNLGTMLRELAPAQDRVPESNSKRESILAALRHFFSGTTSFAEQLLALPLRLLPLWHSTAWGLRFCAHYLRLVSGPMALLYVAIAGTVAGFVSTYFTFRFLPYRNITEPLFLENVLSSLGIILYRVLVPVLITILVAARCGAAVASDIGGKVYGEQIDVLRVLGMKPQHYLLTPILYAFLLGTPLLVFVAFVLARFTSMCVFTAMHPELGPHFWQVHFHHILADTGSWFYKGSGWLLAKILCCSAGMGLIAYLVGMTPKRSSRAVSAGITLNILLSTIFVLLVHLAFALVEFD
jgi:ABC-type multidrug transport system ATPase subunit/ABC-type transporter Mla maintaining outer membrane lipid asymmetry permease subunit MlaE